MNANERYEHQSVVTGNPIESRETVTRSVEGPRELSFSPATIIIIILLAVAGIGTVLYVINNKNQNEAANREATLEASRLQAEAQARSQQAATTQQSQPPVIIQQPVPVQQAPVVVQQVPAPAAAAPNAVDDITLQDVATKRLTDVTELQSVTVTVIDGKASLMGTVNTSELKDRAEQIVKAVRGVKSVDNKLTISNS